MAPVLTVEVSILAKVLKNKDVVMIAVDAADNERKLGANTSLFINRAYARVWPTPKAFSPV